MPTNSIDALKQKIDDHLAKMWRETAVYTCCVKCGFCNACGQQGADDEVHEHQEDAHDIQSLAELIEQLVKLKVAGGCVQTI
jgi:Zn ribbon nucleic-acid-binding protein